MQRTKVVVVGSVIESDRKLIVELAKLGVSVKIEVLKCKVK